MALGGAVLRVRPTHCRHVNGLYGGSRCDRSARCACLFRGPPPALGHWVLLFLCLRTSNRCLNRRYRRRVVRPDVLREVERRLMSLRPRLEDRIVVSTPLLRLRWGARQGRHVSGSTRPARVLIRGRLTFHNDGRRPHRAVRPMGHGRSHEGRRRQCPPPLHAARALRQCLAYVTVRKHVLYHAGRDVDERHVVYPRRG